jgi:cytochrome c oxidase assembly factor CtaG
LQIIGIVKKYPVHTDFPFTAFISWKTLPQTGVNVVMQHWLQNFAYRIEIGGGVFALALLLTLIIAALTIGQRAFKAAAANPVEALRYE